MDKATSHQLKSLGNRLSKMESKLFKLERKQADFIKSSRVRAGDFENRILNLIVAEGKQVIEENKELIEVLSKK